MNRRQFLALLTAAPALPAAAIAPPAPALKPGDVFTMAAVYAVNPRRLVEWSVVHDPNTWDDPREMFYGGPGGNVNA